MKTQKQEEGVYMFVNRYRTEIAVLALVLTVLLFIFLWFFCCAYIDAGNVGIKINSFGPQRGVQDIPVLTGAVFYNPFTQRVHEFPTYMQNITWSNDESISFNSSDGATLSADVGMSFTLRADKIPDFFIKFRKDIEIIKHGYLRNKTRDAITRITSAHPATEIFGGKKTVVLTEVAQLLREELADDGIDIDSISFMSEIRCDDRVANAINAVIESSQRALEAKNKIAQIEAEALQKEAEAKGKALAIITEAEARAKAAELESKSNENLGKSLTPALIQYKMLERWDGVAPKVVGDSQLLMKLE